MVVSFEAELARVKSLPFNPKTHFWGAVRQIKFGNINFQNINQIPLKDKPFFSFKVDFTGDVITQKLIQGTRKWIFSETLSGLESAIQSAGWIGAVPSIQRISEEEPTLVPQDPFYRDRSGNKVFVKEVIILG